MCVILRKKNIFKLLIVIFFIYNVDKKNEMHFNKNGFYLDETTQYIFSIGTDNSIFFYIVVIVEYIDDILFLP